MFMTVVNRGRFDVKSGTRKGRTTSGPSRPVCSSATIEFLYPTGCIHEYHGRAA
jgi:hypothetical protein